jgi:hypothetical protein
MTDHNITMQTLGWDIYDRKHKYNGENGIIVFFSLITFTWSLLYSCNNGAVSTFCVLKGEQ